MDSNVASDAEHDGILGITSPLGNQLPRSTLRRYRPRNKLTLPEAIPRVEWFATVDLLLNLTFEFNRGSDMGKRERNNGRRL